MSVKTVLITGTSTGIGLATAVAAARNGWHVVATMRDTGKAGALLAAAEAAGVTVEVKPLDVTDPASVRDCLAGLDRLPAIEAALVRDVPGERKAAIISDGLIALKERQLQRADGSS